MRRSNVSRTSSNTSRDKAASKKTKKKGGICKKLLPLLLGLLLLAFVAIALLFVFGVLKWPGFNHGESNDAQAGSGDTQTVSNGATTAKGG